MNNPNCVDAMVVISQSEHIECTCSNQISLNTNDGKIERNKQ